MIFHLEIMTIQQIIHTTKDSIGTNYQLGKGCIAEHIEIKKIKLYVGSEVASVGDNR